jgi:hypothetical protein
MPKIRYEPTNFARKSMALIDHANAIIEEYAGQGFNLTLRQLYYQFVARDLLANSQKNYKRLGDIVSKARRAGLIDWNAIVDRTRFLRSVSTWESPAAIVGSCLADALVVKRIALNMDQVEQYDPPPNPAKETDSRFAGYQRLHGDESWELDALSPTTLSDLIAAEMGEIIVKSKWKDAKREETEGRKALRGISDDWAGVQTYLATKGDGEDE